MTIFSENQCQSSRSPNTTSGKHVLYRCISLYIYIYISLLPPWFGDLQTYVTNQKNNNEKKVKMKQTKRTTNKNTWANNYIERRVSKIRIERKDEEKVIHLYMLQNEAYRKSMTTRAYQGYGNCERKTKVNNNTHKWK